jgi:hippurate hydrolase
MFTIGAVTPEAFKLAESTGKQLPSLHSPIFAPIPEPTIKTGIIAMTAAVLELMKKP